MLDQTTTAAAQVGLENYAFRSGWLFSSLRHTCDALIRLEASLSGKGRTAVEVRQALRERIDDIERTLAEIAAIDAKRPPVRIAATAGCASQTATPATPAFTAVVDAKPTSNGETSITIKADDVAVGAIVSKPAGGWRAGNFLGSGARLRHNNKIGPGPGGGWVDTYPTAIEAARATWGDAAEVAVSDALQARHLDFECQAQG